MATTRTYERSPLLVIEKMGDDVFYHPFSIVNHKRMSRRRPSKSGAELGGGGPLESVVQLEGESLFDRLHVHHCC